jgi:hypothetical protein
MLVHILHLVVDLCTGVLPSCYAEAVATLVNFAEFSKT